MNTGDIELILAKMKAIASTAERRSGQAPPKVDANQTRALHRQAYESAKAEKESPSGYACRQTFCGDMFCSSKPLLSLKKIMIKELRMEITHKDRYLLVRIVEPCFKMSGIMAVVEDQEGSISILSIYNYVKSDAVDVEALLPLGTIMAIKEPYYKFSNTNSCVIRCDSPSDIVLLKRTGPNNGLDEENLMMAQKLLTGVQWKGKLNAASKSSLDETDLDGLRQLQLDSFKAKNYYDSIEIASRILMNQELDDECRRCVFYLRGYAYFLVGQFERSFKDLVWILERHPEDITAMIMAGQTLYSLRRFDEAYSMFFSLAMLYPDDEGIDAMQKDLWLKNCSKRLQEKEKGKYDLHAMMVEASHSKAPRLENADFIGPVRLIKSGDRFRVVVTEDVTPGTLLMAQKAFEIVYNSELKDAASGFMLINFKTGILSVPTRSQLTTKIGLKLLENPSTALGLYDLGGKSGDAEAKLYADDVHQKEPIANIGLIHRIVAHNAMCPEVLDETTLGFHKSPKNDPDAGLWLLPSHIQHACDSTAVAVFIGDFTFIRSKYSLKAGDEVTLPYIECVSSLEDRQAEMKENRVSCDCRLCVLEQNEPKALASKRTQLLNDFKKRFKLGERNDLEIVNKTIEGLKESYRKAGRTSGPQQLLYLPYTALGAVHLARDQRKQAAESFELALRALGFSDDHEDYLLRGGSVGTRFPPTLLMPMAPMTAVHIYHYYWNADEYDLAEKWYRIARGLDRILHGGDESVFKRLYHSFIVL